MKKILIIEDNISIADAISNDLRNAGYQVEIAADGEAGLEKLKQFSPDLVTLDLKLPKIDGYRVCELIKSDKVTSNIPVIVISNRKEQIEIKAAYAVGADDYIIKPHDPALLLSKIEKMLR
jgi:DNA-binding response OmpR family regulator